MNDRLFFLDLGRVVAVAFVTAFHLWRFFGEPNIDILGFSVSNVASSGYIGVDIFFVISGYAMMMTWSKAKVASKIEQAKRFFKARLKRIYPPYLFAILFWYLIAIVGLFPRPISTFDIVSHLTMTHTLFESTFFGVSGVLWSLAVEAHFYLLFPLLMWASRKTRIIVTLAAIVYAILVTYYFTFSGPAGVVWRWNVFGYLPLFMTGMLLFRIRSDGVTFLWPIPVLAIVLTTIMLIILPPMAQDIVARSIYGALYASAILLWRAPNAGIIMQPLSVIGQASYSIYLYNYIFLVFRPPYIEGALGFLVYYSGVIVFGILMWMVIEKPTARILSRNARGRGVQERSA